MCLLLVPRLVRVICGFIALYEFAVVCNAASQHCCHYRENSQRIYYDIHEAVCCGNKLHLGAGLSCCGQQAFNPSSASCCRVGSGDELTEHVTQGLSEKVSACCGMKAYDKVNELCCNFNIVPKPVPMAQCCGNEAFDEDKQLCCGPNGNKRILNKNSSQHQCCYHDQFDPISQCCCISDSGLQPQPRNSSCCENDKGMTHKKHADETMRNGQKTYVCGSSGYDPNEFRCCERKQKKPHMCCGSDQRDIASTLYNPQTHICCDGCVSERKPWLDQCCGQTPYSLAERGVLCCNNTLYTDREDGEQCSDIGFPYNPAKWTVCCSQFHGSPGQHCCGTEIFQPHTEICCNGHRHRKVENVHCCGVKAYNIKDPKMKCCSGTLHNVTSLVKQGHDIQCCGSILQNPQDVCCSSDDEQLLYSAKTGFSCCGHIYYNTSLWSCCAGKLSPVKQSGRHRSKVIEESRSLHNLNKTDLCEEIHIGIVESVSPHSIVFSSVLKIHGRNGTVIALPPHYILKISEPCNSPTLIPGKIYFFDDVNVFTDFNHDTILHSLHFLHSKCYP